MFPFSDKLGTIKFVCENNANLIKGEQLRYNIKFKSSQKVLNGTEMVEPVFLTGV